MQQQFVGFGAMKNEAILFSMVVQHSDVIGKLILPRDCGRNVNRSKYIATLCETRSKVCKAQHFYLLLLTLLGHSLCPVMTWGEGHTHTIQMGTQDCNLPNGPCLQYELHYHQP